MIGKEGNMEKMGEGPHRLSTFPECRRGCWDVNRPLGQESSKAGGFWVGGKTRWEKQASGE